MRFNHNHLHLRCEDPDAAATFYCDNFGAAVTFETPFAGTKAIVLELNGAPLMTISGRAEGENPLPGSTEPRYGLDHFGFEVDDMDAAVARLKANGVHFTCEPWTTSSGAKIAFVEGPSRTSVEITQHPAK